MSNDDEETRWTEGNLWVQLRFIIHQSSSHFIYLIIDSLMDCETLDLNGFIGTFFNLRFAAPERLKIVCTGTTLMEIPSPPSFVRLTIDERQEFKDYMTKFNQSLVEKLVSENPKLEPVKTTVQECIGKSKQFLHSTLLVHRIASIQLLSRPKYLENAVGKLSMGWGATIVAMVSNAPSWISTVVSCMILALHPLRPSELAVAVAVAIDNQFGTLTSDKEFDERTIPLDIRGDLIQYLVPLVCVERGEIRFSHPYIQQVLQKWLDHIGGTTDSRDFVLTTKLLDYLQLCLEKLHAGGHHTIPNEPIFGLLEYCLDHWHFHYRKVMDAVKRPLDSRKKWLEDLVLSLFRNPAHLPWLQPTELRSLKLHSHTRNTEPSLNSLQLAAHFGLFDILVNLMDQGGDSGDSGDSSNSFRNDKSSQISAFQYACRYGHGKIVEYLIDRVDEVEMKLQLTRACQRGDRAIVVLILDKYTVMRDSADVLRNILPEVCRMGHLTLVEELISRGAKVDEKPESPEGLHRLPLHEAVDQGHLAVVELLLKKGANAMDLFPDESTPLLRSVERGYNPISDCLIKIEDLVDIPNIHGVTAVRLAARRGDVDLLEKIFKVTRWKGPSLQYTTLPLHEAAAHGHLHAVKVLLKEFPQSLNELNLEGQSALFLALRSNQSHVAKYLFDQKDIDIRFADVYAKSALKQAIVHENLEATEALLKLPGVNVKRYESTKSSPDSSPLTDAVWKDNGKITQVLLIAGVDPAQTVDPKLKIEDEILGESPGGQWNAMHFAAYHDSQIVMELLMSRYPELADMTTNAGYTPLHFAAAKDRIEIVDIMLPGAKEAAEIVPKVDAQDIHIAKPKNSKLGQLPSVRKGSVGEESTNTSSTRPATEEKPRPRFNLNSQTNNGLTAVHIATANGNVDFVKMLIKSGANLNLKDIEGRVALHFAASALNSPADILNLLLRLAEGKSKVDIEQGDFEGKTPLHYAVESSDEAVVIALLRHGADPNATSNIGVTPLYLAVQSDHKPIVEHLLFYGADILAKSARNGGLTALHAAVSSGHEKVVDYLLSLKVDVNALDIRCDTPLHEAARQGNTKMAEMLLDAGANVNIVNARLMSPLQRAILNERTEMASILLNAGADPNIRDEDGDNALTAAIFTGSPDLVILLLNNGANYNVLNRSEMTPLMLALHSSTGILPLLLDKKPDFRICGGGMITVLHKAAAEIPNAAISSIIPLLRLGKQYINLQDFEGQTPLHHAAKRGRTGMLNTLQNHGARMELIDLQGRTAMHHGVQSMSPDEFKKAFESFLKPSPENKVNIPDIDGWTPLHWACRGNLPVAIKIVELLLDSCETDQDRRNMALQSKNGWTALAVAEFHRKHNIVNYLNIALGVREQTVSTVEYEWTRRMIPNDSGSDRGMSPDPIYLRQAKPGEVHPYVSCDDCSQMVSSHSMLYFALNHFDLGIYCRM
jgi:ankyrin repeat protein